MKVQQSLDEFLNRCRAGIPDQPEDATINETKETQVKEETSNQHNKTKFHLSTLQRMNFKISISNNWSTFWKGTTVESPSCGGTQPENVNSCAVYPIVLHLPIYDNEFVTQSLPRNMSMMTLFTLQPASTSTSADDESKEIGSTEQLAKPKLGAYAFAPRSAWQKIEASGIIDEYYWSFRKESATPSAQTGTDKSSETNVGVMCSNDETKSQEEIESESINEGGISDHATTTTTNVGQAIWSLKTHPRSMLNTYLSSLRRETVPSGDDM